MKFPSHVKHIQHPIHEKEFWCDTAWRREFAFTGLDHASANALNEGRLLACPACVRAAVGALETGKWVRGGYRHTDRVNDICRRIRKDTELLSNVDIAHPLYKEMVGMSSEAVPALLYRLDCFEGDWDGLAIWEPIAALAEITGENVIPEEDRGRLHPIIGHWLDWGEKQGIYERIQWDD